MGFLSDLGGSIKTALGGIARQVLPQLQDIGAQFLGAGLQRLGRSASDLLDPALRRVSGQRAPRPTGSLAAPAPAVTTGTARRIERDRLIEANTAAQAGLAQTSLPGTGVLRPEFLDFPKLQPFEASAGRVGMARITTMPGGAPIQQASVLGGASAAIRAVGRLLAAGGGVGGAVAGGAGVALLTGGGGGSAMAAFRPVGHHGKFRAMNMVTVSNPESGKLEFYTRRGTPVVFSRDKMICRGLKKEARSLAAATGVPLKVSRRRR